MFVITTLMLKARLLGTETRWKTLNPMITFIQGNNVNKWSRGRRECEQIPPVSEQTAVSFQWCSHDLHGPPARSPALRGRSGWPGSPQPRLHLQVVCQREPPAGPCLCSGAARHRLPGGLSGSRLGHIFVSVYRSSRPHRPLARPRGHLHAGWPPGLWLLPGNVLPQLSRWVHVSPRVGLF